MTRERWEVRARERVWTFSGNDRAACLALSGARRRLGLEARFVHVRTYRVEVVYAWRAWRGIANESKPKWWWGQRRNYSEGWTDDNAQRRIFTDPLGKHSRRRAKAAALAAKPSGSCVLVAVRRRVRE